MQLRIALIDVLFQFTDQLGRLFNILLQFGLPGLEDVLLLFQIGLIALILGLHGFRVFPGCHVVVIELPVALHDVSGVVHGGKQLTETAHLEDQAEIIHLAIFLHGSHAGTIALQLLFFRSLCLLDLDCLFGNDLVIEGNLTLNAFDLLAGKLVALVHGLFLFDDAGLLLFQLVYLRLLFLMLLGDGKALFPKLINLLLRHRPGLAGKQKKQEHANKRPG